MSGAEYQGRLRTNYTTPQFWCAEDVPAQRRAGEVAAKVETRLGPILKPNLAGEAESYVPEYKSRSRSLSSLSAMATVASEAQPKKKRG